MKAALSVGFCAVAIFVFGSVRAGSDWRVEWEKTLVTAQAEGQVVVYGAPGTEYIDAIGLFQNAYPKIKLVYVPGSGSQHAQRLFAERRAGKYLADLYIGGSGTGLVLHRGRVFDPLPPYLILPENTDQSLWFSKKNLYSDPEGKYIFIMQGNVSGTIAGYNKKLVNPKEIRSYRDLLNSKWKGKMAAFDPIGAGQLLIWKGIYYNRTLGPEFIRRLLTEMDITIGTDMRLLVDWVATGRHPLYVAARATEVDEAKKQGLPVDTIDAPPEESHMSAGWGHAALVNKAPHPGAAKIFINWLLSREGQLQWQKKSDNNSLRLDIPKDMLTEPRSVPREGGQYLIASLPEYSDVAPIRRIVNEALARRQR